MAGSDRSSGPLVESRAGADSEDLEKLHLLEGLFEAKAISGAQDPERAMEVYLEILSDVPARWLRQALRVLLSSDLSPFVPSPAAIRQAVAVEAVRARRRSRDEAPQDVPGRPIVVPPDRWDYWIRETRRHEKLPELAAPSEPLELPAKTSER